MSEDKSGNNIMPDEVIVRVETDKRVYPSSEQRIKKDLSKHDRATKLAYEKGYRVLPDGSVQGITKILKLQKTYNEGI